MADKIQVAKGTRDLLPPETAVWTAVERTARDVFALYGYQEIRTPLIEHTELFTRSVGESTDIVGKEMYTFLDKKGRSLTLRPESTAAVARAYIEHGMQSWPHPVKLFYIGAQFRYERPQRGRYRQFFQIGAECIGDANASADVELLLMLVYFLKILGFNDLQVLLNTVGDEPSRFVYRQALLRYLQPLQQNLGADSRRRLETNPLRILDTKVASERELLQAAPRLHDYLSQESRNHFSEVRALLDEFGVRYRVEPRLVRGLDYYTHTVFEIVSQEIGSQNAIVGGGAYDGLIESLGGPPRYGIGFAIGEDRLLEVLPADFRFRALPSPPIVVGTAGTRSKKSATEVLGLAEDLRVSGVRTVADLYGRSLRAVFKWAEQIGASIVVLIGDEELAAGEVTLKQLSTGEQVRVPRSELARRLMGKRE